MQAHAQLKKLGYNVCSYGTATHVRLPGPSIDKPNVYEFGTPYKKIRENLSGKDEQLYRANGLLAMIERNIGIKEAPERWQLEKTKKFDIVFTYEERVFDAVLDDLTARGSVYFRPVHVININTKDTSSEAVVGANLTVQILKMIEQTPEWEDEIESIISKFEDESTVAGLRHAVAYY
eukprot:TRINITY_DN3856_c0_g1_i1.p1 TRINITY_DN3856_c0_g1~~TRINITY_DN3856_c0_g1_i1.p1  ORF type:complete len:201 (+),score=51.73 TRINITY_DN3856_c0_g1_i1:70-603(+)